VLFVVVLLELDPDSYVVELVYPPSIAVFPPDTFDWVLPAYDKVTYADINIASDIIAIIMFLMFKFQIPLLQFQHIQILYICYAH
jgi:hypothetical protein